MSIVKFNAKAVKESASKVTVETGGFKLTIDTPEGFGGTNQGASPTQYILAALAGCLNVTAHTVAADMNITIGTLEFDIEGDLDPSKFIGAATECRTGYLDINVTMKAETNADPVTLEKWFKAVQDRSAVLDNILNATPVKITLQ